MDNLHQDDKEKLFYSLTFWQFLILTLLQNNLDHDFLRTLKGAVSNVLLLGSRTRALTHVGLKAEVLSQTIGITILFEKI
jgi:hypothetical protein